MSTTSPNGRIVTFVTGVADRVGLWLVLALASVLRFWDLGYPHKLVFDETYYVKDAFTLSRLGYEGSWPDKANASFEAGQVNVFSADPSYVVHPPLGKWIISLGINLFGAQNSFGWRFSVAALGVAYVAILFLVARIVLGSKRWALIAAFLLAIDGHAIVLSRTGLLDGILAFFALLAFYFLLRDRASNRLRFWNRPWLLAMALTLGAASAVKWSGLYLLVAFALYVVGSDVLLARRVHLATETETSFNWFSQITLRGLTTFALSVPLAVATYLASWTGWLVTSGGYFRNWVAPAGTVSPLWSWVPKPLQALWHYHQEAYGFHVNLHVGHPYAANPLGWLLMLRPTSFFYEGNDFGKNGCDIQAGCSSAITALGNPAIWWVGAVAVILVLIRWVKTRERTSGLILLGLAAGYLPWIIYLNRTTFQFYSVVFLPWMLLALVYVLQRQVASRESYEQVRSRGRTLAYLVFCFALSMFFVPIWFGTQIPYWFWLAHMWLPSWI
jgi:dolichyl-phosphate-mannose--protein O-mannosyl transferase